MIQPFVHNIDPIIVSIFGVHIWWYGLSFTLGFLNAHIFLRRNRDRVGLSLPAVYDLTLFLAIGIMIGGRFVSFRWLFPATRRVTFPQPTASDIWASNIPGRIQISQRPWPTPSEKKCKVNNQQFKRIRFRVWLLTRFVVKRIGSIDYGAIEIRSLPVNIPS